MRGIEAMESSHKVESAIDSRGDTGGGDDMSIVDESSIAEAEGFGGQKLEDLDVAVVGGDLEAVEHSEFGED